MPGPFSRLEFPTAHKEGLGSCSGCFRGWPQDCSCGGWIHAEYTGEDKNGPILNKQCDGCGQSDKGQPNTGGIDEQD